jgi:NTP pyrophosphatase (non-canonical NTP hydrolase)
MNFKGKHESNDDQLLCAATGLGEESGEVLGCIKKRKWHGHEFNKKKVVEELGDVLWNIALAADAIGVSMADIAEANIDKNRERYPDGFNPERSRNRKDNA